MFDFKKSFQNEIKNKIAPILKSNGFKSYKKNNYIREKELLIQMISFNVTKYELQAFAYYVPSYAPYYEIASYGISINGSGGEKLLEGKYFAPIYDRNPHDENLQIKDFNTINAENFKKLTVAIVDGVIVEMDSMNSISKFIECLDSGKATFFGRKYSYMHLENSPMHKYNIAVYKGMQKKYKEAQIELTYVKDFLEKYSEDNDSKININIKIFLEALESDIKNDKGKFTFAVNEISDEMRKKYKLIK